MIPFPFFISIPISIPMSIVGVVRAVYVLVIVGTENKFQISGTIGRTLFENCSNLHHRHGHQQEQY